MRSKIIFSVIALAAFGYNATAQQIFKLSQFTQHNFVINPAAAGANDDASIGATYRKMWSGIEGGPQTVLLYGDKYFAKKKVGVAVVLYDDKTGPTQRTGGQINLSYSVKLKNEDQRLMFGLGGNFLQHKIDKAELAEYIPDDPLLAGSGTVTKGDASAGIYYRSSTLNFGASVQQLIQAKLNYIKGDVSPDGKLYRHYNFMASYNCKTDEDNVVIPAVLVKYLPNAPTDVEANVRLEHKDMLTVGFGYHKDQSYSVFAGVKIDHKLAIGYAFDQYKTPLSVFDGGGTAHEVSIRYFFVK